MIGEFPGLRRSTSDGNLRATADYRGLYAAMLETGSEPTRGDHPNAAARRPKVRQVTALALLARGAALPAARVQVAADEFTLALSRPCDRLGGAIVQLVNYGEESTTWRCGGSPAGARTFRIHTTRPGGVRDLELQGRAGPLPHCGAPAGATRPRHEAPRSSSGAAALASPSPNEGEAEMSLGAKIKVLLVRLVRRRRPGPRRSARATTHHDEPPHDYSAPGPRFEEGRPPGSARDRRTRRAAEAGLAPQHRRLRSGARGPARTHRRGRKDLPASGELTKPPSVGIRRRAPIRTVRKGDEMELEQGGLRVDCGTDRRRSMRREAAARVWRLPRRPWRLVRKGGPGRACGASAHRVLGPPGVRRTVASAEKRAEEVLELVKGACRRRDRRGRRAPCISAAARYKSAAFAD
jgi:hypothetical protein